MLIKIILFLFGRGIKSGFCLDKYIHGYFDDIPEKHSVRLVASGKAIIFWKENGKVVVKTGKKAKLKQADIEIAFKTDKAGKKIMTGRRSISEGYARHDILVGGDIFYAMPALRIFETVECYLLPKFITKKLFVEFPPRSRTKFRFYLKCLINI